MANFSQRDVEAVRLAAERMANVANQALRNANRASRESEMRANLNIVYVNLNRIKELAAEYPFLQMTQLEAFEASIQKVGRESRARILAGNPHAQNAEIGSEPTDPFLSMSLREQCDFLGLPLFELEMKRQNRQWQFNNRQFKKPENATLAYFESEGFKGTHCEGAAPLMIMKCACLDYLAKVNYFKSRADACTRAFQAQCWLNAHLIHYVQEAIEQSNETTLRSNFKEIASQPNYSALYPVLDEAALVEIWRAITPARLAKLVEIFARDPYRYWSGWPDLTLARDGELRLVEVKTTDRLHNSQRVTIAEMLIPFGAPVSVIKLKST